MGAPTLKAKKEHNYRRGPTWKNCGGCNFFTNLITDDFGKVHKLKPPEGRCEKMGLLPGRAYRVLDHYICDLHDHSKLMKRWGVL